MNDGKRLTSRSYPTPDGDVGNGHLVADNVAGFLLGEMSVESAVETTGLVGVAVDTVLNLLRSVAWDSLSVLYIWEDGGDNIRLKWLACPCIGPRPPICHMSQLVISQCSAEP